MQKSTIKKIASFLLCFAVFGASAQETASAASPQMADLFRQDGKIYVVISVIAIVFLFVVGLLIYMERKLKRLENKLNDKLK